MTLKSDAKFDEKLTFNLENKMRLSFQIDNQKWPKINPEIFIRALGSVKIRTLMGSFCPK